MGRGIVILSERSENAYLLINHLAAHFEIVHVILEAPHTLKMLRYRLKKLGVWVVAGQLAFLVYDRLWIRPRSQAEIARLMAGHDVRPPDGRFRCTDVISVNGPEATALLKTLQPRVVVVSGTGIIARRVLKLAPHFVNIHCGLTPRYRGVHGAFWAISEGRPNLAGVTIHRVDAGVDTGVILGQAAIRVDPRRDSYRTLPVKQYLAGLPLMTEAVRAALDGEPAALTSLTGDLDSRQWYSPTPGDYLRFRRQMRRMVQV